MCIQHADCFDLLPQLDENSFDSLITDPPAGINFMQKKWDDDKGGRDEWIEWLTGIMKECHRVMKPGAHGFVWAIPRTSHWTATALENAGFEIRDVVTHLFGSGFPKSLNVSKAIDKAAGKEREIIGNKRIALPDSDCWGQPNKNKDAGGFGQNTNDYGKDNEKWSIKNNPITAPATTEAKQWDGWGTALKPASEHWILVRKPISEKTVAKNVLKWGTGAINIDGCRVEYQSDNDKKHSGRHGHADKQSTANIFSKKPHMHGEQNIQGRFPANLVLSHHEDCEPSPYVYPDGTTENQCHDGCPIEMLDKQSLDGGMHGAGKARKDTRPKGYSGKGLFPMETKGSPRVGDTGGASRFFYCAKASKSERNAGCEGLPEIKKRSAGGTTSSGKPTMKGRDRFGSITQNHHPTVKPIKLMRYLIRMITPKNGVVLDPFMGSGTTCIAAEQEQCKYFGIEADENYYKIAEKRINKVNEQCLLI